MSDNELTAPVPTSPEPAPYVDEQDATVSVGWRIENLETADWALSRLGDLEAEISDNEALAELAIQRITERTALLNERAGRGAAFFRSRLLEYANSHRHELLKGGKKKSRALIHGTIGYRKQGGGLSVSDREALLQWARAQPIELGLVRIKEEPAIVEIKQYAAAKSLIPPGMTAEDATDEPYCTALLSGLGPKGE